MWGGGRASDWGKMPLDAATGLDMIIIGVCRIPSYNAGVLWGDNEIS